MARLVHSNGLDRFCRVKLLQQRHYRLKEDGKANPDGVRLDSLTIEGKASRNLKEKIAVIDQEMTELFRDFDRRTYSVQIKSEQLMGAAMISLSGVVERDTLKVTTIEHDGSVMLLIFYDKEFPNFQAPTKHNYEIIDEHSDWKGQVQVIGISRKEVGMVLPHVQKHGYQNVKHFYKNSSTCDEDYEVSEAPRAVLVDKQGTI